MSFVHDGLYVSASDVPHRMQCFEIQLWRSWAPSSLAYVQDADDADDELGPASESGDIGDGDDADDGDDECSLAQTEVVVIGYEVAEDQSHALKLALARIGAPSMEHFLESLSTSSEMQCHLEAQGDESKFERSGHLELEV